MRERGNPIDADLVRAPGAPGNDLMEEWAFLINVENTANYTSVVVINDGTNGQPAVIRVTGPDDLLDRINPSSVVADFGLPFPARPPRRSTRIAAIRAATTSAMTKE